MSRTAWRLLLGGTVPVLLLYWGIMLWAVPSNEDWGTPISCSWYESLRTGMQLYREWGGRYLSYSSSTLCALVMTTPLSYAAGCIFFFLLWIGGIGFVVSGLPGISSRREAWGWSLLFATAAMVSLKGAAQSFYWIANLFCGTAGVIAILYLIGFLLRAYRCHIAWLLGAVLMALMAPGFYEHAAVTQCFIAIIGGLLWGRLHPHRKWFWGWMIWAVGWGIIALLAPGNLGRQGIHQSSWHLLEGIFMAARAGAGIFVHSVFSTWIFLILLWCSTYRSPFNVEKKTRWMLTGVVFLWLGSLIAMHFIARYVIDFSTRVGDSLVMLSYIATIFLLMLWQVEIASRWRPWAIGLLIFGVWFSGNSRTLLANLSSGELLQHRREVIARWTQYQDHAGKDVVVEPLTTKAWPLRKNCQFVSSPGMDEVSLYAAGRYHFSRIWVNPGIPVLQSMASEGMRAGKRMQKGVWIEPILSRNGDWLFLQLPENADYKSIPSVRMIVFTDQSPGRGSVLSWLLRHGEFKRISPQMALAIWGAGENHVNAHWIDAKISDSPLLFAFRLNKRPKDSLKALFLSLDQSNYFSIPVP